MTNKTTLVVGKGELTGEVLRDISTVLGMMRRTPKYSEQIAMIFASGYLQEAYGTVGFFNETRLVLLVTVLQYVAESKALVTVTESTSPKKTTERLEEAPVPADAVIHTLERVRAGELVPIMYADKYTQRDLAAELIVLLTRPKES